MNLAPSGVRKGGAGLDLAIAVGVLVATGQLPPGCTDGLTFCGELGLNGSLRHVPGMIALADAAGDTAVDTAVDPGLDTAADRVRDGALDAHARRTPGLVVPLCDAREAALVRGDAAHGVASLAELTQILRTDGDWPQTPAPHPPGPPRDRLDLADVRGQPIGLHALEVAAAGRHHLLMVGPAGSGKTMLAERLPGLLPTLTLEESLTVTRVHSAAGQPLPDGALVSEPPFRAPHHRSSIVALVGGGSWSLRPGEISLATHGVLFLDEMGEFPVTALEALRQPLEEGVIRVSRAGGTVTFPAQFLLVAAMNPCPCGEGVFLGACLCSLADRARYTRRLSAPLLDRFDLVVPLSRPDPRQLLDRAPTGSTADSAARVVAARARAADRVGQLEPPVHPDATRLLASRLREGALTARGLHKVSRVARTVADLMGAEQVGEEHVSDALCLRAARATVTP